MLIHDLEYEPGREKNPDMNHNKKKSEMELGHLRDDQDFYAPGSYERKDVYGQVVTHQDSKSHPGPRGLNTY